jgi:MFS family permease
MVWLTFGLIGLQYVLPTHAHEPIANDNCRFTWGVEMSCILSRLSLQSENYVTDQAVDFTPYLLQLGLAKSETALVWIAPPLSGLIVQPVVGTISDSSRLKWGRRRPYMLVSSILVAACLLTLAWAIEIVTIFIAPEDEELVSWT